MRKVRLLAAGLPLVVVAITALVVVPNWGGETPDANLAAAQPNLQTALQAAETYYAAHGNSFLGLMNPETPTTLSSIQQIDNYLSYVSGGPSTGPHVISTYVGDGGAYVVLTAFANGIEACWGILDLPRRAGVVDIAQSPGIYYFVSRSPSPAACNAARITSVTAYSTSGFPPA